MATKHIISTGLHSMNGHSKPAPDFIGPYNLGIPATKLCKYKQKRLLSTMYCELYTILNILPYQNNMNKQF